MTSLLIYLKRHCSWLWIQVERMNGWLFGLRYPDLSVKATDILTGYTSGEFDFSLVCREDLTSLSNFLNRMPAEYMACFNPHPFDKATLDRLFTNEAFLMMKITRKEDGDIVGYYFLRCFFIGRAFHGLLVDKVYCNRGLGTAMWTLSMEICHAAGLRMFATVFSHNVASLRSVSKATHVRMVEKLADDYQLIECAKKT